jgi:glycine cleavage system aminomethyltransferase T
MRAMMSLRLDKWFGSWGREFSPDYTPCETGLDRFIRWNKDADWIGKAAATAEKAAGPKRKLVSFIVDAKDSRRRRMGTDLARRRGGGLLHLGRLQPLDQASRSPWASCPPTGSRTA